jgi:putative transposase
VRKIVCDLGLVPCQPRPWRCSLTEQDGRAGPIPDLVNRDFNADKPGQKMVGDITYIDTWVGWVYLATVIDCATLVRALRARAVPDEVAALVIPFLAKNARA